MTTLATAPNTLIIGNRSVVPGEAFPPTPEDILHHSQLGSLVLARRIDSEGNLLMIPEPVSCDSYPEAPSEEELAYPRARERYAAACQAYLASVKADRPLVPVPAALGTVRPTGLPYSFHLEQVGASTHIIPYLREDRPALYRLQVAQIVD